MVKKFNVLNNCITTVLKRVVILALMVLGIGFTSEAVLNTTDSHIINLYLLNEGIAGTPLTNQVPGSFVDSAVTGTPQNHDDTAWPAPLWGSDPDFTGIGDSNGLTFVRDEGQQARFKPWMNVNQGDYVNGRSFTMLVRMYATTLADGTAYGLIGSSVNYIELEGISAGGAGGGRINVSLRDGANGINETFWLFSSYVSGGDPGISGDGWLKIDANVWYNVFLIYQADTSITIAIDDGTTFKWIKTTNVPASFSTLATGFSDSDRHFMLGNNYAAVDLLGFDGRIESVAIWDKALTTAEADAIDLTNEVVFDPANCADAIAHGYRLAGDANGDCYVNITDLAAITGQWLVCNTPGQVDCIENW